MLNKNKTCGSLRFEPAMAIAQLTEYAMPELLTPVDLYLDKNEGVFPGISELVKDVLSQSDIISRYPSAKDLQELIAGQLEIEPDRVLITAGGDEAIDRACHISLDSAKNVIVPSPTFSMYEHYAKLAGAEVKYISWQDEDFPVSDLTDAIDDNTSAIILVSPNNPTGYIITPGQLETIVKAAPQCLIILDLAYEEFSDMKLTSQALQYPNCLVIRTLSKAWGMAGLRVGYAVSSPEIISWLRKAGSPFSVSGLSLKIAQTVMSQAKPSVTCYINGIKHSRTEIYDCLEKLGAKPLRSQANFVLAKFKNAEWVYQGLAGMGIKIRSFSDNPSLADALRITCPQDDQLKRLIHALKTVLKPEAILFDLDGVLADVSQSYHQAIVKVGESYGVNITEQDIAKRKLAGNANNDWLVTQSILNAAGVKPPLDEIIDRFELIYQGNDSTPGLWEKERLLISKETLFNLRSRLPLGIVTGRPRKDTYRFLDKYDLLDQFSSVVCMEDAKLKPSPEPIQKALQDLNIKRAWMIGDMPDDIKASRTANVLPLGILAPGAIADITDASLLKAGAARVLNSLDDLTELLQ